MSAGTLFRIIPVVGMLPVDFEPTPDPTEVAEVFETPLAFLMNTRNHQTGEFHPQWEIQALL